MTGPEYLTAELREAARRAAVRAMPVITDPAALLGRQP